MRSQDWAMAALRELFERASREPLSADISDYSDEFCAGFLAGQENALLLAIEKVGADSVKSGVKSEGE